MIPVGPAPGYHDVRDANMNGGSDAGESDYFDLYANTWLADDERDEDADGLTNYDETHGRMTPDYWAGCYSMESAYGIPYAAPKVDEADSDGDGVLDGADDQDHDDIPNLMELSRYAASGHVDWQPGSPCRIASGIVYDRTDLNRDGKPDNPNSVHPGDYGRVNPFNPCLPATSTRTCVSHPCSLARAPLSTTRRTGCRWLVAHPQHLPSGARHVRAPVVWLDDRCWAACRNRRHADVRRGARMVRAIRRWRQQRVSTRCRDRLA